MIYVTKEQLEQVEYLIRQSIQGNHVLFDPETVRQAFREAASSCKNPDSLAQRRQDAEFLEEAYSVEHHIERMMGQPTLVEKRAYLERLDQETCRRVVRTYFNIVENNLYENIEQEAKH